MELRNAIAKALRTRRGVATQKAICDRAGITVKMYSTFETGERMPRHDTFRKLAHGLGCTVEELEMDVARNKIDELRQTLASRHGNTAEPSGDQPGDVRQPPPRLYGGGRDVVDLARDFVQDLMDPVPNEGDRNAEQRRAYLQDAFMMLGRGLRLPY